jgi:hypothetical protein
MEALAFFLLAEGGGNCRRGRQGWAQNDDEPNHSKSYQGRRGGQFYSEEEIIIPAGAGSSHTHPRSS